MMNREQLEEVYLEWSNDYATIERYAEHKGLHVDEATALIDLVRKVYNTPKPEY